MTKKRKIIFAIITIMLLTAIVVWAQSTGQPGQPPPVYSTAIAGTDGTNLRTVSVDSAGKLITSASSTPPTGTGATQVQGTAASGAASVGNPVLEGGQYNTTANKPTLTTGNAGSVQLDNNGRQIVSSNTGGFSTLFNAYMQALPNAATTLTATTGAYRFYCNNITAGAVTITITDNQGTPVSFVTAFSLAANSNVRFPPGEGAIQMQGVKWNAGAAASINCTVDGWQ